MKRGRRDSISPIGFGDPRKAPETAIMFGSEEQTALPEDTTPPQGKGGSNEGRPENRGSGRNNPPPPPRGGLRNWVKGVGIALAGAIGGGVAGEMHGQSVGQESAYVDGRAAGDAAGYARAKKELAEKSQKPPEKKPVAFVSEEEQVRKKFKEQDEKRENILYAQKTGSELFSAALDLRFPGKKDAVQEAKKSAALFKAREAMQNYTRYAYSKDTTDGLEKQAYEDGKDIAKKICEILPTEEVSAFASSHPEFKELLEVVRSEIATKVRKIETTLAVGEDDDGKKLTKDNVFDLKEDRGDLAQDLVRVHKVLESTQK